VSLLHSDAQSSGTVLFSSVVLCNHISVVCQSSVDILHQAARLVASNCRLFEAVSKIVAAEITGFCLHFAVCFSSLLDFGPASIRVLLDHFWKIWQNLMNKIFKNRFSNLDFSS